MPTEILADKYRLASSLGHGAMGVVYRAHQLGIDGHHVRDVAVKMIRPDLTAAEGETAARLFVREMKAAAQLKSPHVVTVYDWGRTEAGLLYYVMELVEAPTLREVLESGQMMVPQAVEIAAQVANVLVEAHNLRYPIVHRDLKPPNIFIAGLPDNVHVKVGDFGIAKILSNDTSAARTATVAGTPLYMAPEQWTGSDIDTRVDLYALGVILYEMLAGQPPFSGPSAALMHQHLYGRAVPLPEHVPPALRDLVESLLAKSRDDRPPHAQAVADALLAQSDRRAPISTQRHVGTELIAGQYAIREAIGSGLHGVVYRAALMMGGEEVRQVALKKVSSDPTSKGNKILLQRFLAELRLLGKLQHPNVVSLLNAGEYQPGHFFYTMDLVHGPTLRRLLRAHGPFPLAAVLTIAGQLCDALAYVHEVGVLHHDLKSTAVFVDGWPDLIRVRLSGFGLHYFLTDHTGTPLLLTDPVYTAPEAWQATRGSVDARTDLYSLGIILFELLNGKPPFTGDTIELMSYHMHDHPPALPSTIPLSLRQLVERLLAKEKDNRPHTAALVRESVRALIQDTSVRARSVSGNLIGMEAERDLPTIPATTQQKR